MKNWIFRILNLDHKVRESKRPWPPPAVPSFRGRSSPAGMTTVMLILHSTDYLSIYPATYTPFTLSLNIPLQDKTLVYKYSLLLSECGQPSCSLSIIYSANRPILLTNRHQLHLSPSVDAHSTVLIINCWEFEDSSHCALVWLIGVKPTATDQWILREIDAETDAWLEPAQW